MAAIIKNNPKKAYLVAVLIVFGIGALAAVLFPMAKGVLADASISLAGNSGETGYHYYNDDNQSDADSSNDYNFGPNR